MPNWKKVILSGSNAVLAEITASGNLSGSGTATASYGLFTGSFGGDGTNLNLSSNTSISTSPFPFAGDGIISGSLLISSSNVGGVSTASLTLEGSGSTIFSVQGSQGQLFSLTDDLLHDNLVVGDISGDTIFKVSGSGLVMIPVGNLTGSGTATASYGLFTGSFGGDGTNLNLANNTTITVATPTLNAVTTAGNTTTNNIEITGSLTISGSLIPSTNPPNRQNVVIGQDAATGLIDNASYGITNVIVGYEAAHDANQLNNSVLLGWKAGYAIDNGTNNIGIGKSALGSTTTRGNSIRYNIGVGEGSGANLQGGTSGNYDEYNILMGIYSGANLYSNDGNYNNILIGHYNKGLPSSGTLRNSLKIGQTTSGNVTIFPISASLDSGSVLIPQLKVDSVNTANSASGATLLVEGSGSTVFEVIGSEGTLFSVSDNLTQGSLFAVKDINGFPLLDVTRNTGSADIVTIGQSDLLIDSGSLILTGSISVSGSVTNNLTASYAIKALSADTVTTVPTLNAVTAAGNTTTNNISVGAITGSNLLITNTASISYFHTTYQSSSIIHASGSTKFGDTTDDLHQFTGSIESQGPITASAFSGDGSSLTGLNPFPFTASSAAIISRSIAVTDTDSTALRLIGSGSVSQSGIFEVEGSAGPLFSVQDGLDGVLMEVNNISGLPLFQVSSSNEVFVNRGNLTSGVTTATASFAYFTGSFAGNGGGLTNLNVTTPDLDAVTTAGNTTANNITAGIISGSAFNLNNKSAVSFTTTNLNIGYANDWTHINLGKQSTDEIRVNGILKAQQSITASANISASGYVSASAFSGDGSGLRNLPSTNSFPFVGDAEITGSLIVSASHTSQSLSVIGSGSTVFDVIGSEGTLFSIDDDLDGIIFTANNRTGNPVLQASASGEVYIGSTPQSLYTTAVISSTAASVTHSLAIINTSSYDGAFFDYTAHSGSNARAGSVMSVWNGSNISFTETTTTDIGSTADLNIKTIISGSAARLVAYSPNAQYNIKTIIRAL